jgi:pyridoxine 5-phosphate synthase
MTSLIFRVDPAAAMRTRSAVGAPEPVAVAILAEMGGADAVIAHLQEDRIGILERDLRLLREVLSVPFILEMEATSEMIGVSLEVKPDQVYLVPPLWEGLAGDGGLDLVVNRDLAAEAVRTLSDAGIATGIAVDAEPEQVKIAHRIEANAVQIDTAFLDNPAADPFRLVDAAKLARKLKLGVIAGADAPAPRIKRLQTIREIEGIVTGRSLIADAVLKGMTAAVREAAGRLGRP